MESINSKQTMETNINEGGLKVDPNAHYSSWFDHPNPDPSVLYFEPPAVDLAMSLFDPSEQQFLSGFFDNLADENNISLLQGLDFNQLQASLNLNNSATFNNTLSKSNGNSIHYQSSLYYNNTNSNLLNSTSNIRMDSYPNFGGHSTSMYPILTHNNQAHDKFNNIYQNSPPSNQDSLASSYPSLASSATPLTHSANLKNEKHMLAKSTSSIHKKNKSGAESQDKEEKRRSSHIASEQKRRDIIRKSFDRLSKLIPGDRKGHNCSKAVLLMRAGDYVIQLRQDIERMEKELSLRQA